MFSKVPLPFRGIVLIIMETEKCSHIQRKL